MKLFGQPNVDSVLSTVRQKRFCWKEEKEYVTSINYDYNHRPRRQEFEGYLKEVVDYVARTNGGTRCY